MYSATINPDELDRSTLYRLASEASCDPRIILAVLRGEMPRKRRTDARLRARRVLTEHGYLRREKTEAA